MGLAEWVGKWPTPWHRRSSVFRDTQEPVRLTHECLRTSRQSLALFLLQTVRYLKYCKLMTLLSIGALRGACTSVKCVLAQVTLQMGSDVITMPSPAVSGQFS